MKPTLVLTTTLSLLTLGALNPTGQTALASDHASMGTESAQTEGISTLTLDASSLESFKESLGKMKDSLSSSDKALLETALDKLAAAATEPAAGGDMATSTDTEPQTREEKLYEQLGTRLDGKSFGDIVAMAG